MLKLKHLRLLALIAYFSKASSKPLTLIVDAADTNIRALSVAVAAEFALTSLARDSCELCHPFCVLEVIIGIDFALLICIMNQIIG